MNHNVILEGWNCRLRPVRLDDAEFIVRLRNQDFAKGYIHATDDSIEKQKEWLNDYYGRDRDYYWILENISDGQKVGTYGLYNFVGDMAMPGRMVVLPTADFLQAAYSILMREFAFETLGIGRLVGCVVPSNKKVIKFAKLMGGEVIRECPPEYMHLEKEIHQIWTEVTAERWPKIKERWCSLLGPKFR